MGVVFLLERQEASIALTFERGPTTTTIINVTHAHARGPRDSSGAVAGDHNRRARLFSQRFPSSADTFHSHPPIGVSLGRRNTVGPTKKKKNPNPQDLSGPPLFPKEGGGRKREEERGGRREEEEGGRSRKE